MTASRVTTYLRPRVCESGAALARTQKAAPAYPTATPRTPREASSGRRDAVGVCGHSTSSRRAMRKMLSVRSLVALSLLFCAWYFVLPTRLGGYNTMTIVSGPSMEPRFHTGDLVIARPAPTYNVGDIVIYAVPDKLYRSHRVVHRVIDRTEGVYVTKGDNQDHADPWAIPHANILGREVVAIGRGGYFLAYLHNPIYLALVFSVAVMYTFWPSKKDVVRNANAGELAEAAATDLGDTQSGLDSDASVRLTTQVESAPAIFVPQKSVPSTNSEPSIRSVRGPAPTRLNESAASTVLSLPVSPLASSDQTPRSDIDSFIEEWSAMYKSRLDSDPVLKVSNDRMRVGV